MLLLICYTLFKKYVSQDWNKLHLKFNRFLHFHSRRFFTNLTLTLLVLSSEFSEAQNAKLNYQIIQNGNDIGWLRLEKTIIGNKSDLTLVSEIKTKLLLPITVFSREASTYVNGKLIYSSQFRKTNGSVNSDVKTRLIENNYEVSENGKKEKISLPNIDNNLLSLYFQEPNSLKSVYCEKQQCFVQPLKTKDGGYLVNFPNGNSNCYYYKNGICTKIRIKHKLYSVDIVYNSK